MRFFFLVDSCVVTLPDTVLEFIYEKSESGVSDHFIWGRCKPEHNW